MRTTQAGSDPSLLNSSLTNSKTTLRASNAVLQSMVITPCSYAHHTSSMLHSFPNPSCSGCYYDSQDPTTSHYPSSPSWGVSSLPMTRVWHCCLFRVCFCCVCGELQGLFSSSMFADTSISMTCSRGWHGCSSPARQLCYATPTSSSKTLACTEGRK